VCVSNAADGAGDAGQAASARSALQADEYALADQAAPAGRADDNARPQRRTDSVDILTFKMNKMSEKFLTKLFRHLPIQTYGGVSI
jgi:hypothetical protein